jgi:O-acetylserine/cysteine efflux transporter
MTETGGRASIQVRLTLLVIVAFFGGSLPAYKLASESFGPGTTNLIRFSIAAAMLSFVARGRQKGSAAERSAQNKRLLLIGVLGIGIMAATMAIGVDKGSAVIASIVVGLEPVGVALAGVLLVGDKPSLNSWVALGVGAIGVVVASGLLTEPIASVPVVSIFLLLATVVTFSGYTAFVRTAGKGVDPLVVSARTQLGALFLVIPSCLMDFRSGGMIRGDITGKALAGAVFLGVGSAIAYLLLCLVLANQPSNRVAVSMFLTPMFGVFFSWLVVNERLRVRDAVAGLIVLLAVWISEWAPPFGRRARANG